MGEPNSIMAEMLQLCLLAGSKTEQGSLGEIRQVPVLEPSRLTPVTWTDSVLWPGAGTTTIFDGHVVPSGQMLVATYISLCTSLQDQSSLQINFGMVGSPGVIVYSVENGTNSTIYYSLPWQSIFNTPTFICFPPSAKPKILLSSAGGVITVDTVTVDVNMSGFLLDVSYWNLLKRYQKVIYFD